MTLFPTQKNHYSAWGIQGFFYSCMLYLATLLAIIVVHRAIKPSIQSRAFLLSMYTLGTLSFLFGLSLLQSFQFLPFPLTFVLGLVITLPTVAVMTLLCSPRGAETIIRRGFILWETAQMKRDGHDKDEDVEGGGGSGKRGGGSSENREPSGILEVKDFEMQLQQNNNNTTTTNRHAPADPFDHSRTSTRIDPSTPSVTGGASAFGGNESLHSAPVTPQRDGSLATHYPHPPAAGHSAFSNASGGTTTGVAPFVVERHDGMNEVSQGTPLSPAGVSTHSYGKAVDEAEKENRSKEEDLDKGGVLHCGAVSGSCPPISAHLNHIQQNKVPFGLLFVAFFLANFIFHITMYGGCNCFFPNEYTTWASRASQESWCNWNEPCHAYHLVGQNCTSLNSVVHWVGDEEPSHVTVVKVCLGGLDDAKKVTECKQPDGIKHRVKIQHLTRVPGDNRYVVHASTEGLAGDTLYTFFYTLSDGGRNHTKTRVVRTLPCGNHKNIDFIGGGDYYTSSKGQTLLEHAMKHTNDNAYFLYLGGDLAYSNNMRFCFRRFDKFLDLTTSLKRHDGGYLPLVMVVGNHEGGGYELFTSKEDREEHFYFYPNYFPSFADGELLVNGGKSENFYQADDRTTTYHRHIIGSTGWIIIDSGSIFTIDEQIPFLNASIKKYSDLIDAGQLTKIIVTYHNPAYPSVLWFDQPTSKAVRDKIVPIMEAHWPKIPWALENHDHVYKRTHPLLHGKVSNTSVVINGSTMSGGIIYSGDGALGVSLPDRNMEHRWYHEKTKNGDYALVATLLSEDDVQKRLARAAAVDGEGAVIDEFYV